MKSVLFITDELRVGGGETYFYKIENLINRKNFNLYTAAENGECYGRIKNKQNFFQLSSNKFKKILQLKKIIKSNNISVVHCNSFNLVIIVIMVKKIFNMTFKILYTKHNATKLDNTEKFKKIINNNVEKLITVCDYDKNTLLGQGILKEKVISIPNGIDIDQFKFKPRYYDENKELNIGILARLSEEKNHKFFLKVIEKLRDSSDIKFKAFIAGDGILKNDIANEIKEKELPIDMVGNVDKPEDFLRNIDIKMLVSNREVFPMTILEAMCVGSIVISSNVGGVSDSVNNKTGYLMNEYNEEDYVEVIKRIYNEREHNKQLIVNARKQIEDKFSVNTMLKRIENLYKEELR